MNPPAIAHRTVNVTDPIAGQALKIFYRESGPADAPVVLLLHGFPTSSHMFRGLIPALADKYRVIAPDLPGFGFSDALPAAQFKYTFEHLAKVIEAFTDAIGLSRFALYIFDYGAPVGLRLALARPELIAALISQNGNAYEEGLSAGWTPIQAYWKEPSVANREALRAFLKQETTRFQYTHGVEDAETRVAPEAMALDQFLMERPGNDDIQLDLLGDYKTNVALYPRFQEYFRVKNPPTLAVWGKNDPFFLPVGAEAYRRDNPHAIVRFVDGGHFPLETHLDEIVGHVRTFLSTALDQKQGQALFNNRSETAAPPAASGALDAMRGLFGFVPNLAVAMAEEPAVLDAYLGMLQAIRNTALSPVEQQVAMVAASQANAANYGVAVHATLAEKLGAAAPVVQALRTGRPLPDGKLETLRCFARSIAENRTQVSDARVAAMLSVGFDHRAMVAVFMAVAAKTFANGIAHLARPQIDAGFLPEPR
jgi:AhpD family alkylhydroperoxidase